MFAWIEYLQFTLKPENILAKLDDVKKNILIISGDEDHCFLKKHFAFFGKSRRRSADKMNAEGWI